MIDLHKGPLVVAVLPKMLSLVDDIQRDSLIWINDALDKAWFVANQAAEVVRRKTMLSLCSALSLMALSAIPANAQQITGVLGSPAQGLPNTGVGTFSQAMYDMAVKQGWIVISMKNDWKRVFAFGE